jgi:ABC-type antimicrobial peptide transport system permease subunit
VYGVVGYRVAQRMKEIAIRVALGSPRWRVVRLLLSDTMAYVGVGLAAGLPLSFAAAAAIRRYLFGVEPGDGVTLAAACAIVIAAALVAAYLPARRAPRVDPIAALRIE